MLNQFNFLWVCPSTCVGHDEPEILYASFKKLRLFLGNAHVGILEFFKNPIDVLDVFFLGFGKNNDVVDVNVANFPYLFPNDVIDGPLKNAPRVF